jgi:signal transduction histidine kinase
MGNKKTSTGPVAASSDLDMPVQDLLDAVEDSIVVVDTEYRVRFANAAALQKVGAISPVGKLCYQAFENRDRACSSPLCDCPLRRVVEDNATITVIHPLRMAGADTYLKVTAYPLRNSDGNVTAIVELRRDVTAERELESQLLRRHHELLALSHVSSAISGVQDLDTILRVTLDNVLELVDSDIGGILLLDGKTKTLYYRVQRGLSARYAEEMRISAGEGIAGRVVQGGEPVVVEDISRDPRAARPDLISAEGLRGFASIPLRTKDRVIGVMNVASHLAKRFAADDISLLCSIGEYLGTAVEQVRLYERLARASERYRRLLEHALTAQEQERKRIARELHDETSQAITGVTLSLQAARGMAEAKGIGDTEFLQALEATHSYAVQAGNEIVRIMKELRPTLLDELGMAAAIHRYAKDTLQAKGINVAADFAGTERRFPPEVEVTLFRIAQGTIGNILEHSEAKNASIKLECTATGCRLQIEDDGKGFDASKLTRVDPSGRGAGVFTMKERVGLVGGNCRIESRPGRGTKVVVNVPVAGGEPYEEDKGADS